MSAGGRWSLPPNAAGVQTEYRLEREWRRLRENGDASESDDAHLGRMPTPGERRALVFLASVAALGVAVRGWREFHPPDPNALAGSRTALARQIQAVDSAIAVTSSKRRPRDARAATESLPAAGLRNARARPPAAPSPSKSRGRKPAEADTLPRDPRQAYWDRSLHFDSVLTAMDIADKATVINKLRDSKAPAYANKQRAVATVGGPVDLDIADLDELAGLPMIGPALARRIFSDRVENGPFGSIAGLERIPGITHAFARRLEPFVTFSLSPRLGGAGERRPQSKKGRRPGGGIRP